MKINVLPPAIIFMVDNLPPNTGGVANGPVIRLLKKYENDEGIKMHELEHVKQWWTAGIVVALLLGIASFAINALLIVNTIAMIAAAGIAAHSLMYMLIKPYRYWAELKAYTVQASYAIDKLTATELFGGFISKYYKLSVTMEEATSRLRKALNV